MDSEVVRFLPDALLEMIIQFLGDMDATCAFWRCVYQYEVGGVVRILTNGPYPEQEEICTICISLPPPAFAVIRERRLSSTITLKGAISSVLGSLK